MNNQEVKYRYIYGESRRRPGGTQVARDDLSTCEYVAFLIVHPDSPRALRKVPPPTVIFPAGATWLPPTYVSDMFGT